MKAGQLTGPRRYEIIETDEPKIQNGQVMVFKYYFPSLYVSDYDNGSHIG